MPRLPGIEALGDRQPVRVPTGIASYQVPAGAEAPGVALSRLGSRLQESADSWAQQVVVEKQRHDRTRVEDAVNELLLKRQDLKEGDAGYVQRRGVNANGDMLGEFVGKFDGDANGIESRLDNDEQRELFRRYRGRALAEFRSGLLSHIGKESNEYADQVAQNTVALEKRNVIENWNNPAAAADSIQRIEQAFSEVATRQGWSVEKRQAARQALRSDIHAGVIDRLLANRQDVDAQSYYERIKPQLEPEEATKVERALTAMRERHAAEADAERKARAAELTSDVEIAVRRGRAGYAQVEDAYRAGILTPAKRTELTVHLDKENERARDAAAAERAQLQRVTFALGGGGFLDFRSGDDKKAVDAYFSKVLAPSLAKAKLDPQQSAQTVAEFTARTGIIPTPIRETIRGALRAGAPDAKLQAADFLDRLKSANPRVTDDFSAEDIRLGNLLGTYARAGVAPVDAVRMAEGALNVPKPEQEAREERYQHDKMTEKNAKKLASEMSGFRFFSSSLPGKLPDAMAGEYEVITRNEFLRTGDLEAAQKTALDQVKRVWGVTSTGPKPTWMKLAPEVVYGVPGEDPKWIREQLQRDIRKAAIIDKDAEISLAADSFTARQDRPSYPVLLKDKNGVLQPLIGADGRPLRFRPDFGSSEAGTRRQKALEALRDDAATILSPAGLEPAPVSGRARTR